MKSIKEKAEENCIKYGSLGDIAYSEFIDGANYVLDAIEKLTNNQNWCAFPKQSHKELKESVEQLKKLK